jgi:hypothetical protein
MLPQRQLRGMIPHWNSINVKGGEDFGGVGKVSQFYSTNYHLKIQCGVKYSIAGIVLETDNQAFSPSPFPRGGPRSFLLLLLLSTTQSHHNRTLHEEGWKEARSACSCTSRARNLGKPSIYGWSIARRARDYYIGARTTLSASDLSSRGRAETSTISRNGNYDTPHIYAHDHLSSPAMVLGGQSRVNQ